MEPGVKHAQGLTGTPTLPSILNVETIHSFAPFATIDSLRLARRRKAASRAAQLAIDGLYNAFNADMPVALDRLSRAARLCASSPEQAYVADLLAPYLLTACKFTEVRALLRSLTSVPQRLRGPLLACEAVLEAADGNYAASRRLSVLSLDSSRAGESVLHGRTLGRAGIAAYYRHDYGAAVELGFQSAQVHETEKARWPAAAAYALLLPILQDWGRDGEKTTLLAVRMMQLADEVGHRAFSRYAVQILFMVAAELHNTASHAQYRRQMMLRPTPRLFVESVQIAIAEALGFCWTGDFDAALGALRLVDRSTIRDQSEVALLDAVLAIIAAAQNQPDLARHLSRSAILRSSRSDPNEQLCDLRNRERARIIAAAACFIIGDGSRGRRALSRKFDPTGSYLSSLSSNGINEENVPPLFRGYAALINAASSARRASQPSTTLSSAELKILRLLPTAGTLASVADEMGKSAKTVQRQVESIYSKLGANNRAQAIQKAREAGILT